MYYVIPSWYHPSRPWYSPSLIEQTLHTSRFDDMTHLIRLFQAHGEPPIITLLAYSPHSRIELYTQQIGTQQILSFFDYLQGITETTERVLTVSDIDWGVPVTYHCLENTLLVYHQQDLLASVRLHPQTHKLLTITQSLPNSQDTIQAIIDDRGFTSSLLYSQQGKPAYQDYLSTDGVWQFREDLLSGQVQINPKAIYPFKQATYPTIQDLIEQEFPTFLHHHLQASDSLIVAADLQHTPLIAPFKAHHAVILSFFGDRFPITSSAVLEDMVQDTRFVVVDTLTKAQNFEQLKKVHSTFPPCYEIPPFNTALNLGWSQRQKENQLYLPYTPEDLSFPATLSTLLTMMHHDDSLDILIGMSETSTALQQWITENFPDQVRHFGMETLSASELNDVTDRDENSPRLRIRLTSISNEDELIEALKYTRLIIDLTETPDTLTQISGISMGIPQIHHQKSSYITHGQNGHVLQNTGELAGAVAYYLYDMNHWNKAMMHATQQIEAYSQGKLFQYWHEKLQEANSREHL